MEAVLIISAALYCAYVILIMAVNYSLSGQPVPPSVSENFYLLESREKGLGYLFFAWCAAIGMSVMAVMIEYSAGRPFQFLAFLAGGALCFTGAAPAFKGHERIIHYASAGICALAAVLWVALMGYACVLLAAVLPLLLIKRNIIFRAETALFLAVYVSLFILAGHADI
jgi:hypothetical protein